MSQKLIIDISGLELPLKPKNEKTIMNSFKECTGWALFWDKGERTSGSIHGVDAFFLANIIADVLDRHPDVKLLLKINGVIQGEVKYEDG